MYVNEKSDNPSIYRAESDISIVFKAKKGHFDFYDKASKQSKKLKEVEIIPVSDSRFTIRAAENVEGEFIFSGLYKSTRQKITVLRKKDGKTGVYKEGYWERNVGLGDQNLKFVRLLFCLVKDGGKWKRAEFDLRGVSAVQWSRIAAAGTDGVLKLSITEKAEFEAGGRKFYQFFSSGKSEVPADGDTEAKAFASEVEKMYRSYDESYAYYEKQDREGAEQFERETGEPTKPVKPVDQVEIPTINLDDDGNDIRIEDVPF